MKKKILIKLVAAIVLSIIIGLISGSLMPLLGNDVALGQLENDDAYFIAMNTWYTLNIWLTGAAGLVWATTGVLIVRDIYKYMKEKKENM